MTPAPVRSGDAARLAVIHAQAFETPWSARDIEDVLLGPGAYGFALDGAGFILARVVAGEAEILTLAVRPEDRRRGCAGALVEAAIVAAIAGGAQSMFLEVAEDNPAALALYARRGFVGVGRRPGYYQRADAAVAAQVMRLDLNR